MVSEGGEVVRWCWVGRRGGRGGVYAVAAMILMTTVAVAELLLAVPLRISGGG